MLRRATATFRPGALTLGLALVFGGACRGQDPQVEPKNYPAEMAAGYCGAVFNCPCEEYPYPTPEACYVELAAAYDQLNDEAYLAGLSYDGACPAKELEALESLACNATSPELAAGVCVPPCSVWHGSLGAGFPCQVLASSLELGLAFSNCAQGLACTDGVCSDPCQSTSPGVGEPCPDLSCVEGAICDETMTCAALPGPGESCADGQCDPRRAVCVADSDVCVALPSIGQPCVVGQCDASSTCGADQVCVARPPLACGLIGGDGAPGDGDSDGDGDTGDGDGDGDGDTGDGDGDTGDGDGDTSDDPGEFYRWSGVEWTAMLAAAPGPVQRFAGDGTGSYISVDGEFYHWQGVWQPILDPAPGPVTGYSHDGTGHYIAVGTNCYHWQGTWVGILDPAPADIEGYSHDGTGHYIVAGGSVYHYQSSWVSLLPPTPGPVSGYVHDGTGHYIAVGDMIYSASGNSWEAVASSAPGRISGYMRYGTEHRVAAH